MSEFFDKSGRAIDDEEMIIHSDLVKKNILNKKDKVKI